MKINANLSLYHKTLPKPRVDLVVASQAVTASKILCRQGPYSAIPSKAAAKMNSIGFKVDS